MRRASATEVSAYRGGLTLEDSDIVAPAYVKHDFLTKYGSVDILFQIKIDQRRVGVIRAVHQKPAEMLIDLGDGDLWWMHPNETIGLIGYGPVP